MDSRFSKTVTMDKIIIPLCASLRSKFEAKHILFFDKNGVFHRIKCEEYSNLGFQIDGVHIRDDGSYGTHCKIIHESGEAILVSKAITFLKDGDTVCDLIHYLEKVKLEPSKKYSLIERVVARIYPVVVERETDNSNKNSFDFVRVTVGINNIVPDVNGFIKDNFSEIVSMVLKKIEQSRSYKKYGVPVNFLMLTKATIRRNMTIDLLFELKRFEV